MKSCIIFAHSYILQVHSRNSMYNSAQFSSVAQLCLTLCDHMDCKHASPPCPSPSSGAYSNSCPSSRWWLQPSHPLSSLLLLPSIFPSIRVFANESVLRIRWPKCCNFSFSISPSNECSGLISFRIDWLDILAVQGTIKSLFQHHSSKASIPGTQLSSWSNSHIHSWLLEKPQPWLDGPLSAK